MLAQAQVQQGTPFELIPYPDRPRWLEGRQLAIGGSDAPALWGESPYGSPVSVYASKVLPITPDGPDDGPTEIDWLEIGTAVEPVIARLYERQTRRSCQDLGPFTILRSTRYPWMSATLDRVVRDPKRAGLGILQIKNRGAFGERFDDGIPLHVRIQAMHEAEVFGATWGSVAALVGGNRFVTFDFDVDAEFMEMHVEKCRDFWNDHVVKHVPPPTDATEATKAALGRLYPTGDKGVTVDLAAELEAIDRRRVRAKRLLKQLEVIERECSNALKAAIGSAAAGLLPSGVRYVLGNVAAVDVAAHTKAAHRRLTRKEVRDGK